MVVSTYDAPTLHRQVEHWTGELGITRVKIKIGERAGTCVARDLDRVGQVRDLVGPEVEVFVDANGGYSRKQAVPGRPAPRRARRELVRGAGVLRDFVGLRLVREALDCDVTAGEYGSDLAYFDRMLGAGAVNCLQADVTRTDGITEWQRIAALAQAAGVELSAHCAPTLHLHVASAVTGLRPAGNVSAARGVSQRPGGWSEARYNAETGPPVMAPLLVTVVGGMGLLAALLRREEQDR